jgi:hypothetical protein
VRLGAAPLALALIAFASCHGSVGTMTAPDATLTCTDLDAYCGGRVSACVRDWSTASMSGTWCVRSDAGLAGPGGVGVFVRTGCDGYNVVRLIGFDSGIVYVYDASTGALVGIAGAASNGCAAGKVFPPSVDFSAGCGTGSGASICDAGP